jgi:DNA-binding response OmpR family regulator
MTTSKKKILIIEDEKPLARALELKLTHEGFEVKSAFNGEEGLEVALHEHPDLIMLDIIMPVMDGITMLKKLREANEWGKTVPVIFLTNLGADDEKIMKAIADNVPAYYLVPYNQ